MILKVQLPLLTTHKRQMVLVYNKSRSVMDELPEPKGLRKAMKGEPKAFFHGHTKDGYIYLDKIAKWQDW